MANGPKTAPIIAQNSVFAPLLSAINQRRNAHDMVIMEIIINPVMSQFLLCYVNNLQKTDNMLVSIPPKYAVSQVIGYLKGKSAIHVARVYMGKKRNYKGQHFWARGYHVSTVGRNENTIRKYIK